MEPDLEQRLAEYLLGRLPEQEEAELEDRYLEDDARFEELLAMEADLRDAYARGELPSAGRQAFEERLLAAASQKERQAFAEAFRQHQNRLGARAVRAPKLLKRWALPLRGFLVPACAALAILIAGAWWLARKNAHGPADRNSETADT